MARNRAPRDADRTTAPLCPYIGFPGDRETRALFPTPLHRCWRQGQPDPVGVERQQEVCLAGGHLACPRFSDPAAIVPGVARRPWWRRRG